MQQQQTESVESKATKAAEKFFDDAHIQVAANTVAEIAWRHARGKGSSERTAVVKAVAKELEHEFWMAIFKRMTVEDKAADAARKLASEIDDRAKEIVANLLDAVGQHGR